VSKRCVGQTQRLCSVELLAGQRQDLGCEADSAQSAWWLILQLLFGRKSLPLCENRPHSHSLVCGGPLVTVPSVWAKVIYTRGAGVRGNSTLAIGSR